MKNIYNESIIELYNRLETNRNGISEEEAEKRLKENGENKLIEGKKKSNIAMFLDQFKDFMIILLNFVSIFSAIVSYIRNESFIDSIVILVIVIINATLSFIEEKKANNAVSELNKMFVTNNYVIRDGIKKKIDVKNIVVGDILELEAGDYISADARIIESYNFEVNESTLTGESKSIKKETCDITGTRELYERNNMVFSGCSVTNGHAFVLVTATGMDTELGKIATSLITKKGDLTPLQKKVNQISKVLTYIILSIILIMMLIGLIMHNNFFDVLMLSISLSVAAIPEGLSSIITIILSLGMSSMAKRNVIIRKISSVETLGSTDIICSDKTGTITQNKMVIKLVYVNNKLYNESDNINNADMLKYCACSCMNVIKEGSNYIGDETEIAIYKYFENNMIKLPRIKEFPFDSDRKMMSTINIINDKEYSFTKGGLESIISNCKYYLMDNKMYIIDDEYKKKLFNIEKEQSSKSLRILAFSYKYDDVNNPEQDMIFIGLLGMMDPPRANVLDSITLCHKAGLKPVMITGDNINTAVAIASSVNIIDDESKAVQGKVIDKMSDEELLKAVNNYQVYARVSPNTKLRIVEALQTLGYVVAMTGDGVNDAPAIQKADIGIGMGKTGTDVVKKVADCILVDDSFSTIVNGVEEGRRITSNIKKVILYLLAGNIVEVILVFVSMLLNMEMFNTLQLLWINLITDSIPAIMLAFEKSDSDIMEDLPSNRANSTFFTPLLNAKIIISALLKSIIMIFLYLYYVKTLDVLRAGSLMFIYLIANELLYAFNCRNLKKSILNKNIFSNKKLTIGVSLLALIQFIILSSNLSKYFIVDGLGTKNVIVTLLICLFTFILGELTKPLYTKYFKDYAK